MAKGKDSTPEKKLTINRLQCQKTKTVNPIQSRQSSVRQNKIPKIHKTKLTPEKKFIRDLRHIAEVRQAILISKQAGLDSALRSVANDKAKAEHSREMVDEYERDLLESRGFLYFSLRGMINKMKVAADLEEESVNSQLEAIRITTEKIARYKESVKRAFKRVDDAKIRYKITD